MTFSGAVELYFGLFTLVANEVVYNNEKTQALIALGNVSVQYEDGSIDRADIWVLPEESAMRSCVRYAARNRERGSS